MTSLAAVSSHLAQAAVAGNNKLMVCDYALRIFLFTDVLSSTHPIPQVSAVVTTSKEMETHQ